MQKIMQKYCSVFRSQELISKGIKELEETEDSLKHLNVEDKSLIFNTDLVDAFELDNLMIQSKATLYSALYRKESRGAHAREDYNKRDDKNWLVHSLVRIDNNKNISMNTRQVNLNTLSNHTQTIQPKVRIY